MPRLPLERGPGERGAALLSVLLLVAMMAVIAAVMLERLNLATRLAVNAQAMTRARLVATSAETLAMARLKALVDSSPDRTVDPAGLLGRSFPLPLAGAVVEARIDDAGNCFNVNSLVQQDVVDGALTLRPAALAQLRALMAMLGVEENEGARLSDAMADWIDSDSLPLTNGAEDETYRALPVPYRTAGQLVVDLSELRAVRGMTPVLYQRLRPWLCALPAPDLSPIQVNTLRLEQAPLLSMLSPGAITLARARAAIAARPAGGWASAAGAVRALGGDTGGIGTIPPEQLKVRSRWFLLTQTVRVDPVELEEQALIDVGVSPPRIAFRSWGDVDSR
ncbi:type II secretion system minor pseudopilin GspK [Novosphingobium sp. KCTC 2891]|uniref:type II secretion system minor pseudopilin GspK n=1 Tax=Novosphingobium sp. KCTC 2891 TaxID=2989730 RepID=UPI0022216875|nr:type II secretion system minor pseudopilin GspK [Novosphingobium sp. KCTC 2891]MCW1382803.1 type II secretion system minor pseudopilin GspK [Novosphingobium sp. KCTC 2891]